MVLRNISKIYFKLIFIAVIVIFIQIMFFRHTFSIQNNNLVHSLSYWRTKTGESETTSQHNASNSDQTNRSAYLVYTEACKIPATPIMTEYYKDSWTWREEPAPDCREELHFIPFVVDDEIIELKYYDLDYCSIYELKRDNFSDEYEVINHGKILERHYNVSSMDMFMTDCNNSYNFEANIRTDKDFVQKKLNYWKDAKDKPISVLMIGLDTSSRSHVHRSLPKTLKIMESMGFVDFKGYHSVYPTTIPNFFAFLMGLSEDQVNVGCRPSWFDVVDSCPLIWQNYDTHKYMTMYLDDWLGSFQWASGVGFAEQPTDYYLHPLFKHLNEIRNNKSTITRDCASSETLPSFMIRYTERFLRKFKDTPFFAFTWFTMPLHEYAMTLPNMDERLSQFFTFLQSTPEISENTLIMLIGDHGERYGIFSAGSIEGFLERVLVPCFLRVPESLKIKHPEINFQQNLLQNSDKLVTGFDIHQTLLHTLALSSLSITPELPSGEFQAQHENRSSLFVPIENNRDCSTVNIPAGLCVCNTTSQITAFDNPYQTLLMFRFACEKLNEIVEESKYSEKCESWDELYDSVVSAHVIEKMEGRSKVLLKFKVRPDEALFEVQIQVNASAISDSMEIIGEFSRISRYGNTSWCVASETDEDKFMKNYCHCRDEDEILADAQSTTQDPSKDSSKGENNEENNVHIDRSTQHS